MLKNMNASSDRMYENRFEKRTRFFYANTRQTFQTEWANVKKIFRNRFPFFIFHANFSFLSFLWIVKLVGGKIGTSVIIIGKIFPLIFVSKILFGSHRNRKKLIGISKENFFVNDNYVQNFITFLFLFFFIHPLQIWSRRYLVSHGEATRDPSNLKSSKNIYSFRLSSRSCKAISSFSFFYTSYKCCFFFFF